MTVSQYSFAYFQYPLEHQYGVKCLLGLGNNKDINLPVKPSSTIEYDQHNFCPERAQSFADMRYCDERESQPPSVSRPEPCDLCRQRRPFYGSGP